jgi:hydroxyacylglutathione hydrolase
MEVKMFVTGPLFANAYVVSNNGEGVVIDCGGSPKALIEYIKTKKLKIKYILITHGHGDHIHGLMDIKEATGAEIGLHKFDEAGLTHAFNLSLTQADPVKADFFVKHKDKLEFGGLKIKVIETPGHSPGGVCYYVVEEGIIFTGDTLFKNAIGRDDFPGGSWGKLRRSLKNLLELDPNVKVYPGHGQSTTIGVEKKFLESAGLLD